MKAAVCHGFGEPLVVEDLQIDPPGPGEVKVKVAACAMCHSDVSWIRGDWGGKTPMVVGHEGAGTVVEVGPGVTHVQPGDPVLLFVRRSCGHCFYCTLGRPFNCETRFPLDLTTRLHTLQGAAVTQGCRTAAFAEFAVVDQSQVVPIPRSLPFDRACLLSCGVITGVGAVFNTARIVAGSSVVVVGTGGVGLNTVQGAALAGAARIIAVDIFDNKLEAARLFGATHTINARRDEVRTAVLSLTENRGVDYALVAVGRSRAITQACELTRKGGVTVVVGMPADKDALFTLNADHLTEGRTVMGSLVGSARLAVDIPRLIELYQQGRLKLDELITRRYQLGEINEAIASMERGEALRNVILL
jgi:Zn-dependent alcohol dehydrogenase